MPENSPDADRSPLDPSRPRSDDPSRPRPIIRADSDERDADAAGSDARASTSPRSERAAAHASGSQGPGSHNNGDQVQGAQARSDAAEGDGEPDGTNLFDIADEGMPVGVQGAVMMLRRLAADPWGMRILIYCVGILLLSASILIWPNPSGPSVTRTVGIAVAWMGAGSVLLAASEDGRPRPLTWGVVGIVVGVVLFVWGSDSPQTAARALGGLVLVFGAMRIRPIYRSAGVATALALGVGTLIVGLMFLLLAENLIFFVLRAVAFGWASLAIVALIVLLDPQRKAPVHYSTLAGLVGQWLDARTQSAADRRAVYDNVLFEGREGAAKTRQFYVLMGFASVIASFGIVSDSTAVVIGAMLVAPLMTPLMATAITLTMGWPKRLRSAGTLVLGGIAVAVGIGFVTALIAPTAIDTVNNSQIASRSNPTLIDLFIAVAAGGAGAFSLSRKESSGSLPGVAVAIALVPPLAVTGICWSQGDWGRGTGALLLFATNALAIVIVGGLMFILTGVAPLHRVAETKDRMRTAAIGFALAAAVVTGMLVLNGSRSAANLVGQARAENVAQDWVKQSSTHRLERVILSEDDATVVITGTQSGVPSVQELANELSTALGRKIHVDLRTILEDRYTADGS